MSAMPQRQIVDVVVPGDSPVFRFRRCEPFGLVCRDRRREKDYWP
jgi:hypothetical protein